MWLLLSLFSAVCAVTCLWAYAAGKNSARKTKAEEINDAVFRALLARDRLRRDSAYADRVRQRFSR